VQKLFVVLEFFFLLRATSHKHIHSCKNNHKCSFSNILKSTKKKKKKMSYNVNRENNKKATIYLKNISDQVDDDLLFELGTQFGEVVRVNIPLNKDTGKKEEFAFIEFAAPADAQYMRDVIAQSVAPLRLFGRNILVAYSGDQQLGGLLAGQDAAAADALLDIGAKLTIYNLDLKRFQTVELLDKIREYFSQFGRLAVPPSIQQSTNTATVSFTSFEASDAALKATDNQFLFGQDARVRVTYARREDGKGLHGSVEERALYSGTPSERQAAALALQQASVPAGWATSKKDEDDDVPDWAKGLNPYSTI
jgi:splicing factor 3B subunit 4